MTRATEISELRRRIAARRAAGRPIFHLVARLEPLVTAELRDALDEAQRERAADRREPGSFQRELELDER